VVPAACDDETQYDFDELDAVCKQAELDASPTKLGTAAAPTGSPPRRRHGTRSPAVRPSLSPFRDTPPSPDDPDASQSQEMGDSQPYSQPPFPVDDSQDAAIVIISSGEVEPSPTASTAKRKVRLSIKSLGAASAELSAVDEGDDSDNEVITVKARRSDSTSDVGDAHAEMRASHESAVPGLSASTTTAMDVRPTSVLDDSPPDTPEMDVDDAILAQMDIPEVPTPHPAGLSAPQNYEARLSAITKEIESHRRQIKELAKEQNAVRAKLTRSREEAAAGGRSAPASAAAHTSRQPMPMSDRRTSHTGSSGGSSRTEQFPERTSSSAYQADRRGDNWQAFGDEYGNDDDDDDVGRGGGNADARPRLSTHHPTAMPSTAASSSYGGAGSATASYQRDFGSNQGQGKGRADDVSPSPSPPSPVRNARPAAQDPMSKREGFPHSRRMISAFGSFFGLSKFRKNQVRAVCCVFHYVFPSCSSLCVF
jgi:hypothetical protein